DFENQQLANFLRHPIWYNPRSCSVFSGCGLGTRSLVSLPSESAPGDGPATTTDSPEAQASQTETQLFRQTLLGRRSPVLACLGAVSHCRHSRDGGPLASSRISHGT